MHEFNPALMSTGLRKLWESVVEAETSHAELFAEFVQASEEMDKLEPSTEEWQQAYNRKRPLSLQYKEVEPWPTEMSEDQAREFLSLCRKSKENEVWSVPCRYDFTMNWDPEVRRRVRFFITACKTLSLDWHYYAGGWCYRAYGR